MKRMVLSLALAAFAGALTAEVEARSRGLIGFSYAGQDPCYLRAFAYPAVARAYPRHRFTRFHRPHYYHRVYFRHRPFIHVTARTCY